VCDLKNLVNEEAIARVGLQGRVKKKKLSVVCNLAYYCCGRTVSAAMTVTNIVKFILGPTGIIRSNKYETEKYRNEEAHNLYPQYSIVMTIISKTARLTGNVARMGNTVKASTDFE
jgi:hypothetical protein